MVGQDRLLQAAACAARFDVLPDAPVTKFTMNLRGGKRGLLSAADNLCAHPPSAKARLVGQNNRGVILRPRIGTQCAKHSRKAGKR